MPSGASRFGGPVYDARIDPSLAGTEALAAERLAVQTGVHLFGDKSAAARVFSHYWEEYPSRQAVEMMGLARERDRIETQVQRKAAYPFPGVTLGHVPAFAASPRENPISPGSVAHLTHHAHKVESKKATRRRFGRG
jgi:hypothetical protein